MNEVIDVFEKDMDKASKSLEQKMEALKEKLINEGKNEIKNIFTFSFNALLSSSFS